MVLNFNASRGFIAIAFGSPLSSPKLKVLNSTRSFMTPRGFICRGFIPGLAVPCLEYRVIRIQNINREY